jgi:RNA polymerase-interacting CarD/CdnL/TRCF family regulator
MHEFNKDELILRKVKTSSFGNQMFTVLSKPKNVAKGNWKKMKPEELLVLLKGEVAELEEAMKQGGREEIADEACDVANYAMMIVDNYDSLWVKLN